MNIHTTIFGLVSFLATIFGASFVIHQLGHDHWANIPIAISAVVIAWLSLIICFESVKDISR
jgi:hypothetical protein